MFRFIVVGQAINFCLSSSEIGTSARSDKPALEKTRSKN
jgi:hypothetical protein